MEKWDAGWSGYTNITGWKEYAGGVEEWEVGEMDMILGR